MTIFGIGVDLLHVPRMAALVKRRGADKIAARILSPLEREAFARLETAHAATRFLGVRWAVKEAAYKALYPGLRPTWKELTYASSSGTKPTVTLSGASHGLKSHVSVSHDGEYVVAYVVVEDVRYSTSV